MVFKTRQFVVIVLFLNICGEARRFWWSCTRKIYKWDTEKDKKEKELDKIKKEAVKQAKQAKAKEQKAKAKPKQRRKAIPLHPRL